MPDKFCPYNISALKQITQRNYDDDGREKECILIESKVYLKCTQECGCRVDGVCKYSGAVN